MVDSIWSQLVRELVVTIWLVDSWVLYIQYIFIRLDARAMKDALLLEVKKMLLKIERNM